MVRSKVVINPITNWNEIPEVFDLAYACRIVPFTYETLQRWSKQNKFPAVKITGKWVVTKKALMEALGITEDY